MLGKLTRGLLLCATTLAAIPAGATLASAETVRVWSRESEDSIQTLRAVAAAFTKKTGIEVDLFYAMTDFEQRIARAAAGRDLPDLVLNDATMLGQLRKMKIVEPVDPATIPGAEAILPAAWDSVKGGDGKDYAVPVSAQAFALFIRKDWREKLGLPVPTTWEEVHALAKAFTAQDPDGNGKADTYGFLMPLSTTRGYTSWFASSFIWQAGGDFVARDGEGFRPTLATPEVAAAMTYLRSFLCEGLAQPGAINATTADAVPSFRSGQTGMLLSGPYHIALFDKEPGRDKIEVVPPPAGPGGMGSLAEGTSAYFMRGSKAPEAARAFVSFLISEEGQKIAMAAGTDAVPIVRLPVNAALSAEAVHDDPRWGVFAATFAAHSHYMPAVPNWTPIRLATAEGFNRILSDCQSDVAAGLAETDKAVAAELKAQDALAGAAN